MRTKIVGGNWKMNPDAGAARRLAESVWGEYTPTDNEKIILFPPAVYLGKFTHLLPQIENWFWGAQDCSEHKNGAYTGEISASMLRGLGVAFVLIGHSERRQYFGEDGQLLSQKINAILEEGMSPIFCCGEPLSVRESGKYLQYVSNQLEESVWHIEPEKMKQLVVAYEPIWAIGTGLTATPEQAQEVHAHIRNHISDKFGKGIADELTIIYGGSCKPDNARELFSMPDIDGGLIGGASLVTEDFFKIIEALSHE